MCLSKWEKYSQSIIKLILSSVILLIMGVRFFRISNHAVLLGRPVQVWQMQGCLSDFKGGGYQIKQRVNCQSTYIIYLGTCSKCRGQYVGKTTKEFRRRHSGHKSEIKNLIGGLGHQYGQVGAVDMNM